MPNILGENAEGQLPDSLDTLRVLLLEDNPLDGELTLQELRNGGFNVTADVAATAEEFTAQVQTQQYHIVLADYNLPQWTGMEALQVMAQKERPNLIILDIGLPAGDGFVVLERLQKNAALATIPVIVLTARDPQTNKERTLKAGATAFLQKPADNAELLEAISAALDQPPGTMAQS
jgi:DNA-binding response OmpR family regulator